MGQGGVVVVVVVGGGGGGDVYFKRNSVFENTKEKNNLTQNWI